MYARIPQNQAKRNIQKTIANPLSKKFNQKTEQTFSQYARKSELGYETQLAENERLIFSK